MPYEIKSSSEGYCVHKQGGMPVPGGCHKSKSKALRHMRALYANEPEMMKTARYDQIDFTPPASVRAAAEAGLAKRREFGRGGTGIGIARARDLSGGKSISPDTARRMVSFFARHEVDKRASGFSAGEDGYPSNGRIAWELWGGDAGQAWANKLVRQMEAAETVKADGKGYGARAGETIRGNLARGVDGKFSSAGDSNSGESAEAGEAKPTQRRQRLGRTAAAREEAKRQRREAKRQTAANERDKKRLERLSATEQRKRERLARREAEKKRRVEASAREVQENRKRTLEKTPLNQEAYASLLAFAEARDGDFDPRLIEALAKETGLVTIGSNGAFRLNPESRAFLKALDKGDARAAMDAFNRAGDRRDRDEGREEKRRDREESEKEAGLSVFKDASGRYRWVLLSSTAHRDRDGEIVSTKALAQDVARADADKDYGPLRWWHMPGADIGDCDFNAMSGRMLVESGTFRSEAIGEAVYKAQENLQASLGFRHPATEPDNERIYHNIRRFERSLTPRGRAANPFTMLVVKSGERTMEDEKVQEFKAMFGHIKEDVVQGVLERIQAAQKEADSKAAYKEAEDAPSLQLDANGGVTGASGKLTVNDVVSYITADHAADPVTTLTTSGIGTGTGSLTLDVQIEDDGREYAGDLAPKDLAALVAAEVARAMAPLMSGVVEQVKSFVGASLKSDDVALLQEQQARKALEDAQARSALEAKMVALETQLKEAKSQLDELTGEQPRAMKQGGYRASQAADSVPAGNYALKSAQPAGLDPNFFSEFLGGMSNQLPPQ